MYMKWRQFLSLKLWYPYQTVVSKCRPQYEVEKISEPFLIVLEM